MPLSLPHLEKPPQIPDSCYVDPSARINGDVTLGEGCSVWFNVSIRGDVNAVKVGAGGNIQDGCVFHTAHLLHPLIVGDDVTFGHGVIAHGCTIGSRVLVGMQSLIMDGAVIGDDVILGAGSLLTESKTIPSGTLAFGRPAKVIRELSDQELLAIKERAKHYREIVQVYQRQGLFSGWRDNLYHQQINP